MNFHACTYMFTFHPPLPPSPRFQVIVCDETGEDPHCHNSACFLGLCTSIADHLTYLGYEMRHSATEC